MAKKNDTNQEVALAPAEVVKASIPTPLRPEDLMCPPGYKVVKEEDYDRVVTITQKLIGQKKELYDQNEVYKSDLHTIVQCLVELQPLVGGGGFNPAAIMKLMANKEKLAAGLKPMFEVIEKYTTQAPAAQLTTNGQ
jgi:hypothetical protein